MFSIRSFWRLCSAVSLAFYIPSAMASESSCLSQVETALEKVYCQVVAANPSVNLPTLGEFKRNSESIQRLLLKRPAKKLGLSLPQGKSKSGRKVKKHLSEQSSAALTAKQSSLKPSGGGTPKKLRAAQPRGLDSSLVSCKLKQATIVCAGITYELQSNLQNKHVSSAAFTEENTLHFPPPPSKSAARREKNNYLAECYERYLEKMLSIGLAGSTMSYSRFYYIHQDILAQGLDFSERFATMFNFLKKDKATMAVKDRYGEQFPADLKQCMRLSRKYIVCDKKQDNWVYLRQ